MRRVEFLIRDARLQTDNEFVGTDAGMSDDLVVRFLNAAQDDIFSAIVATYRNAFYKQTYVTPLLGTESYAMPADAFLAGQAVSLEYSRSGLDKDYYPLKRVTMRERMTAPGVPDRYSISNGKIYAWPVLNSSVGMFRLGYTQKLPTLDKRRAVVFSRTVDAITNQLTAMTIVANGTDTLATAAGYFSHDDYVSISDPVGQVLCTDIPQIGCAALTGVVNLVNAPYHTLSLTETVPTGAYVLLGRNATGVSQLNDICEEYLIQYASWKMYKADCNQDYAPNQQELVAIRERIVDSYAEFNADVDYIPIIDDGMEW